MQCPASPALAPDTFLGDVLAGLHRVPRTLPCKYFYDQVGAGLFEQICTLPEYYLTRTELALMHQHARPMADLLGPRCLVIEYGSGSGVKTRLLLEQLVEPAGYVPVDISSAYLERTAEELAQRFPHIPVTPLCADFTQPLVLPAQSAGAARRIVYFPGSTIGNFTPEEAVTLFRQTAALCGPGGALLLGVDLKKDPAVLHAAYNDRQGVTAAFNLNLLARINRELGGNFDCADFWHYAFYQPVEGRIEMHLMSRRAQRVRIVGETFDFAEGESIRTEYSYKYSAPELRRLARAGGFQLAHLWTNDAKTFAVAYLVCGAGRGD
ncbi:MAG TPA: L-histidine N(alpha)-methyltransferase [Gemmataceae bacterium]|nr:L-histidine N(alpha)-methyltransferase [Gemmataceae bacterium]